MSEQDLLQLTPEQAHEIYSQGSEAVTWALLKLSALAHGARPEAPALSTPSSQVPPYAKPPAKKRRKKRGRATGHKGEHRRPSLEIDRRETHTLGKCPDCGGPLGAPGAPRRRVVEDIHKSTVVTTEHTIHPHWCPKCRKRVEPAVTDAMPHATIGNRALALSSWLHYGLGQSTAQIVSVFDSLFHFPVSTGGLVQQWRRLAEALNPWYEQLADEARASAVLCADETGWRVDGKTHWLWCFTNPRLTFYHIDPTRSGSVLDKFLAECFDGTLVSDFFGAYNRVTAGRQACLVHLLREIKKVGQTNKSVEWAAFAKRLKRLVRDAIRLSLREDRHAIAPPGDDGATECKPSDYERRVARIHRRLDEMTAKSEWLDADCKRLVKRLEKHRGSLFTFLDRPDVPSNNNRAEREIRPAVIARKNQYQNASAVGASTQSVLMSIYRTLKLRGLDPLESIAEALAIWIATGKLPALPSGEPPPEARPGRPADHLPAEGKVPKAATPKPPG